MQQLTPVRIPTEQNIADLFTKPLPKCSFEKFAGQIVQPLCRQVATVMMITKVRRNSFTQKYPKADDVAKNYGADGYDTLEAEGTWSTGRRKYYIEFYKKVNGAKQLIAIHLGMRLLTANNRPDRDALQDSPVKSTQNEPSYSPTPYPSESKGESDPGVDGLQLPEALLPSEGTISTRRTRVARQRATMRNSLPVVSGPAITVPESIGSYAKPPPQPGMCLRAPGPALECQQCHLVSNTEMSFLVCAACANKAFAFSCKCVNIE